MNQNLLIMLHFVVSVEDRQTPRREKKRKKQQTRISMSYQ